MIRPQTAPQAKKKSFFSLSLFLIFTPSQSEPGVRVECGITCPPPALDTPDMGTTFGRPEASDRGGGLSAAVSRVRKQVSDAPLAAPLVAQNASSLVLGVLTANRQHVVRGHHRSTWMRSACVLREPESARPVVGRALVRFPVSAGARSDGPTVAEQARYHDLAFVTHPGAGGAQREGGDPRLLPLRWVAHAAAAFPTADFIGSVAADAFVFPCMLLLDLERQWRTDAVVASGSTALYYGMHGLWRGCPGTPAARARGSIVRRAAVPNATCHADASLYVLSTSIGIWLAGGTGRETHDRGDWKPLGLDAALADPSLEGAAVGAAVLGYTRATLMPVRYVGEGVRSNEADAARLQRLGSGRIDAGPWIPQLSRHLGSAPATPRDIYVCPRGLQEAACCRSETTKLPANHCAREEAAECRRYAVHPRPPKGCLPHSHRLAALRSASNGSRSVPLSGLDGAAAPDQVMASRASRETDPLLEDTTLLPETWRTPKHGASGSAGYAPPSSNHPVDAVWGGHPAHAPATASKRGGPVAMLVPSGCSQLPGGFPAMIGSFEECKQALHSISGIIGVYPRPQTSLHYQSGCSACLGASCSPWDRGHLFFNAHQRGSTALNPAHTSVCRNATNNATGTPRGFSGGHGAYGRMRAHHGAHGAHPPSTGSPTPSAAEIEVSTPTEELGAGRHFVAVSAGCSASTFPELRSYAECKQALGEVRSAKAIYPRTQAKRHYQPGCSLCVGPGCAEWDKGVLFFNAHMLNRSQSHNPNHISICHRPHRL